MHSRQDNPHSVASNVIDHAFARHAESVTDALRDELIEAYAAELRVRDDIMSICKKHRDLANTYGWLWVATTVLAASAIFGLIAGIQI